MPSARVLLPADFSQWKVEFHPVPDPPKGHPEWYQSVTALFSLYEYVRGMIVQCFPFLSISLVWLMQPRRSAPREGDTVMAAHEPGPGNTHSIHLARHDPWISSNNLTYTSTSTITRIHVCNRIPRITICILMRPNAVIRALTRS